MNFAWHCFIQYLQDILKIMASWRVKKRIAFDVNEMKLVSKKAIALLKDEFQQFCSKYSQNQLKLGKGLKQQKMIKFFECFHLFQSQNQCKVSEPTFSIFLFKFIHQLINSYLFYSTIHRHRYYFFMIRHHYVQRREAKCNFCFQWFNSEATVKNSLHLCGRCLDKALNTISYKVPSPDGSAWYQLYLFKNNVKMGPEPSDQTNPTRNSLLEDIDMYRDQEIKKLSEKWLNISDKISELTSFGANQMEKYTELLSKSFQNYSENTSKLIQSIGPVREELTESLKEICNTATRPRQRTFSKRMMTQADALSPMKFFQKKDLAENNCKPETSYRKQYNKVKIEGRRYSQQVEESPFMGNPSSFGDNIRGTLKMVKPEKSSDQYDSEKRARDLEIIAQDALKSKIYHHLEQETTVPPALYLVMTLKIYDALKNTVSLNRCIELISYDISDIEMKCYLEMLSWECIDVVKLVKVGLSDQQFGYLVDFLQNKKVESLVVSSNKLTERSCVKVWEKRLPGVKNLYLGRNKIHKNKIKDQLKQLQSSYNLYL